MSSYPSIMPFHTLFEKIPEKIENVREQLANYMSKSKLECLILGMSGGIDSTLVSAICQPVLQSMNKRLIGYSIPIKTNTNGEISRAMLAGNAFTEPFAEVDLTEMYEASFKQFIVDRDPKINHFQNQLQDPQMRKIMIGNIKARLRMMFLYNQARMMHGAVLSTDNLTEYLLGFWTINGDVGDISPVQYYYKTEIYQMAHHLLKTEYDLASETSDDKNAKRAEAIKQSIYAVPTDGLGITNSDLDQMGAPDYETVDRILLGDITLSEKYPDVMKMHHRTEYKRNIPIIFDRY